MIIQRCVVYGKLAGVVETRTVFTAEVSGIPSDLDTDGLWGAYLGSIFNPLGPIITSLWQTYQFETSIPAGGGWEPIGLFPYVAGGSGSGDYLPNAVAAVLLGKASGVRHMGRKFFSGVIESAATANSLTSAALVTLATVLTAYLTPIIASPDGTLTPGVVDQAGTFRPFIGGTVSSLLGSMRRRKPGLGI